MSKQYITPTAYARLRGVSKTAVQKAIKTGRLKKSIGYSPSGLPLVNPALANKEWVSNAVSVNFNHPPAAPAKAKATAKKPKPQKEIVSEPPEDAAGGGGGNSIVASRAVREVYQARLAKMTYEEKTGKLIDASTVRNQAFRLARTVRDSILNVPDRISAELFGMDSVAELHERLTEELRQALESLQNEQ